MKQFIFILVLTFTVNTPQVRAGWFSHDQTQQEEISKLQGQLQQQQDAKGGWIVIAFLLGIGCVITLVAGAAIGSNGRKNAKSDQ